MGEDTPPGGLEGVEGALVAELPDGMPTFLLTDVEGSARLAEQEPAAARAALERHDELIAEGVAHHGGVTIKRRGEGDSVFAVFARPSDAIASALTLQQALGAEPWPTSWPLRVRMALHTGEAEQRSGDYYGATVNRCARLRAIGHGGQVLLSEATAVLVRDSLPEGAELRDLGEHRLHELARPERAFQLLHSTLAAGFPPLRTPSVRPTNLPAQPTPLIAREDVVRTACDRLLDPSVRLLTLTGPAGIGKTRLAIEVAGEVLDGLRDGAFFVDLAPIADPDQVAPTIAQALGLRGARDRSLAESLTRYLRDKELLLLLDNLEQVLAAGPRIAALLTACPTLKVLATSRAALRLRWEHELAVPPLELADLNRLPPPEALAEIPSVALFVARARAVKPDFRLDEQNAPAVAEICARLDGLPLAIELAAARSKAFPPRTILGRLAGAGLALPLERAGQAPPLHLLSGGARDLPARHQTLREAIGWSYHLLGAPERKLFRRLGVFVGGCTTAAAAFVCALDEEDGEVAEGLASLTDKNLLRQDEAPGGDVRFRMLETIRAAALEALATRGEAEAHQRRHAQFFLDLAEEAGPGLLGPHQGLWLDRLAQEHDNLRAALRWATRSGADGEVGLRLGGALWRFWEVRGHLREVLERLAELLAVAPARTAARASGLYAAAHLAFLQGDYETARSLHAEGLEIRRELGDRAGLAAALNGLGLVARVRGDGEAARPLFDEALRIYRAIGDRVGEAFVLHNLGRMAYYRGDHEAATARHQASLALRRELGESWGIAHSLSDLADLAQARGDAQAARGLLGESLTRFRDLGDRQSAVHVLEGFATLAVTDGRPVRAVRLLGAASAVRDQLGGPGSPARRAAIRQALDQARRRLGEERYAAAWAEGRVLPLDRAAEEALEAEARPGSRAATGSTGVGPRSPLSQREGEVAALVARGRTNRQIAAELAIAEGTAANHVQHILDKLGFTARAQIAAWAVGQGLLSPERAAAQG